ncbi:PEP-CTERM sorting domain-containing protein [Roseateles sp.]|uniref:DUF7453 family protein n=1 Tax=Roseateles sp. TaxID=1971397 RepID=UPI00326705B4
MKTQLSTLALAVATSLALVSTVSAAPALKTVALTGWNAPDLAGLKYSSTDTNGAGATFSNPRVGNDGQITFTGRLAGPDVQYYSDTATFVGLSGAPHLFLRSGVTPVPGLSSNQVWSGGFDAASNNPPLTRPDVAGITVVKSGVFNTFGGGASSSGGILQGTPAGYTVVALGGNAAPGVPGKTFNDIKIQARGGQNIAYYASYAQGGSGLFISNGATSKFVTGFGVAAPGYAAGQGYVFNSVVGTSINANGQFIFAGSIQQGTTFLPNESPLYYGQADGSYQRLISGGDTTPGAAGFKVGSATAYGIDSGGKALIRVASTANTSTATRDELYLAQPGSFQFLMNGKGYVVPGTPANTTVSVAGNVLRNASAQITFTGQVLNVVGAVAGDGIFAKAPGVNNVQAVAIRNGTAPGAGLQFRSIDSIPLQDNAGDIVFAATLMGAGINANNDQAYFVWKDGALSRLLGDGDQIQVMPGDFRTIGATGLTLDATHVLDLGNLDASGLFAFHATFTDGTGGVFTTQLSPVPEPGTAGMLAAGASLMALFLARRRNRRSA